MLFDFKNSRTTYQRMMNKVFKGMVEEKLEVYIDDMIVETVSSEDHVEDLAAVFQQLKKFNMRLNS